MFQKIMSSGLIIGFICLIISGCSVIGGDKVVNNGSNPITSSVQTENSFPPILEQAIRETLDNPTSEIHNLDEIEYIDLQGNIESVDLSSITRLENLRGVELKYVKVINYDFLYNLPHLTSINFYGVRADELPDFSKLKLKTLGLYDGDIKSLDFLPETDVLTNLSVVKQQLESLEGLRNAKNIKALNVSYNPVSDINILQTFEDLERLEIRSTKIKDISALSKSNNLILLDIRETEINTVSPVAKLPNLRLLLASKENIIDIENLPDAVQVSEENVLAY